MLSDPPSIFVAAFYFGACTAPHSVVDVVHRGAVSGRNLVLLRGADGDRAGTCLAEWRTVFACTRLSLAAQNTKAGQQTLAAVIELPHATQADVDEDG